MIAQMLPGFRDVRTPLITGYLWLTGLWIILGLPVPTGTETEGVLGSINALARFLSPAVTLVVLSFLAYLLGILGSPDIDRFLRPGTGFVGKLERLGSDFAASSLKVFLSPRMLQRLTNEPGSFSPALTHPSEASLRALIVEELAKHRSKKEIQSLQESYNVPASTGTGVQEQLIMKLHKELVDEALDPSASLLASDEKLYNNFDRTRSEADFRFCITAPILFISATAAWRTSEASWPLAGVVMAFGVLASMGLVFKGWTKLHESTDIAVAAIIAGNMKTRTLGQLVNMRPDNHPKTAWWKTPKNVVTPK